MKILNWNLVFIFLKLYLLRIFMLLSIFRFISLYYMNWEKFGLFIWTFHWKEKIIYNISRKLMAIFLILQRNSIIIITKKNQKFLIVSSLTSQFHKLINSFFFLILIEINSSCFIFEHMGIFCSIFNFSI